MRCPRCRGWIDRDGLDLYCLNCGARVWGDWPDDEEPERKKPAPFTQRHPNQTAAGVAACILALLKAGHSQSEVARELGVGRGAVKGVVRRAG